MERLINSIYGVIIYYIIIALLTVGTTTILKRKNEANAYISPQYAYLSSSDSSSI